MVVLLEKRSETEMVCVMFSLESYSAHNQHPIFRVSVNRVVVSGVHPYIDLLCYFIHAFEFVDLHLT
jgi:hypothetical protein